MKDLDSQQKRVPAAAMERVQTIRREMRALCQMGIAIRVWPTKKGFRGAIYPRTQPETGVVNAICEQEQTDVARASA